MRNLNFRTWFEFHDDATKDIVLNFLKDKLNINDEESILSMSLSAIDKKILSDLMNRGFLAGNEDAVQMIRNGSGSVMDLVDRISGRETDRFLPTKL